MAESAEGKEASHTLARHHAPMRHHPEGRHKMKKTWIALGLCVSVVAVGCSSEKAEIKEDRLTVGKVQGEIKVGMAASQVAELLGSPPPCASGMKHSSSCAPAPSTICAPSKIRPPIRSSSAPWSRPSFSRAS